MTSLLGFGKENDPKVSGHHLVEVESFDLFHAATAWEPRGPMLDGFRHATSISATQIATGAFSDMYERNIPAATILVHCVKNRPFVRPLLQKHGGPEACRIPFAHYHSLLVAADRMKTSFDVAAGLLLASIVRGVNGYLYFMFSQRVGVFGWKTHAIVITGDQREQAMPLQGEVLFATPCP